MPKAAHILDDRAQNNLVIAQGARKYNTASLLRSYELPTRKALEAAPVKK
jgi:hypothetical protein